MPTLLMNNDNEIVIDYKALNIRHMATADWVFEYDQAQSPAESSKRKRVFSGMYIENGSAFAEGVPARAVEFSPEYVDGFGRECASLAKANAVGVGPRVFQIHKCPPLGGSTRQERGTEDFRAVVIEEDAGINLAAAIERGAIIPGSNPEPLHPVGTSARNRENAKIKFDIFAQLHNLHTNGMFHRDLRVANVCVRRYGDNPEDIRATLIDFELIADASRYRLEASAKEYLDTIFQGKTFLLPIEIDMGYLAAFCYELETGRPIREAGPEFYSGDLYPFFKIKDGTVSVQRITQSILDELANEVGLIPVNEGGMTELTGETLGVTDIVDCVDSLIHHGDYLDAKDVALLRDNPEFIILSNRERIALESFETYKKQVREQGGEPKYEDFYEQDLVDQRNALDNIAKYRAKLESFGYRIVLKRALREHDLPVGDEGFSDDELERMAEMEHVRWMEVKMAHGWKWGPERDDEKKIHPSLVPYVDLPENEKDKDRRDIRNMVPFLREAGLVICR